jgi:hypothetical protein
MNDVETYNNEVNRAHKAKAAKKFMQEYFDITGESLYAGFMNVDTQDTARMQELVLLHRNLIEPQLWLDTIIETGKLAEHSLSKLDKQN